MTTPEKLAKWREEAATVYMTDDISFITSNEKRNYIAGYLRAKQEDMQAMKLTEKAANISAQHARKQALGDVLKLAEDHRLDFDGSEDGVTHQSALQN